MAVETFNDLAPSKDEQQLSGWARFSAFYKELWLVFHWGKVPQHTTLYYRREILHLICMYPNREKWAKLSYRLQHYALLLGVSALLLAVICGVQESTHSVIDMGADFAWIIGMSLINAKVWYLHLRVDAVDDVIKDFEYYNKAFQEQTAVDEDILQLQRTYFMFESLMNLSLVVLVLFFQVAICAQPLWSDQVLPYHSIYPFEWQNPAKHPRAHFIIYVAQFLQSYWNLVAIQEIDLLGLNALTQTSLNLRVLCIEMRKLGRENCRDAAKFRMQFNAVVKYHQHIIRIVDKTNDVFNGCFIVQFVASFLMISLSTFETLVAKDEPKIAAKFELFMLVTFVQLSCWCFTGDMVRSQSLEVAHAAFEIHNWHTKSKELQRDIMFVIQRAQKPLVFIAKPYLPITLSTYMLILKQCYSILALLLETLD